MSGVITRGFGRNQRVITRGFGYKFNPVERVIEFIARFTTTFESITNFTRIKEFRARLYK